MAPITTRAVLLRAHEYGETSRILRFYTEDHGLVSVMARGVKGRSGKEGSGLTTFASGHLTAYIKPSRDLQTYKDFQCTRFRAGLGADPLRFAGASAVAELVLQNTEQEAQPALLAALNQALDLLETATGPELPTAALAGLWRVVDALGFTPELRHCVVCGAPVGPEEMARFDFAAGGVRCERCGEGARGPRVGPASRRCIGAMLRGDVDPPALHPRRHLSLLSDFLAYHVAQRPMKSLAFLGGLLPQEEAP